MRGRSVGGARLHQLFGAVQFLRTVNRYGFVSVQRLLQSIGGSLRLPLLQNGA